jgi:drug/metabolite transporter (DMT)-like permease
LYAALILIGAAWGITQPFAKIAVSEGYRHFGIIFWQFALGALLLAVINRARGQGLPMGARHIWRFMSSSR